VGFFEYIGQRLTNYELVGIILDNYDTNSIVNSICGIYCGTLASVRVVENSQVIYNPEIRYSICWN